MTLLEYITADPDGLGLPAMAEAGNDAGISEAINLPRFEDGLYISREALEVFVIGQGIIGAAELTAQNTEAPGALRAACISLSRVLSSSKFPELQLDNAATVAMRAAFVAGGVMSQSQDDALVALGVRQFYSVAERDEMSATTDEVSAALAPGRGAN